MWVSSNRREAIWDAMKRRETFATSGTRLRVRVFAGTNLRADLPAIKPGQAPQLLVWARKVVVVKLRFRPAG